MDGKYQNFFAVFLSALLYLTSTLQEYRGDLDFASYYHAKVNRLIYPSSFPNNETEDIAIWREALVVQSKVRNTYGVGVVDIYTDLYGDHQEVEQLMRIYNSNMTRNNAVNGNRRDVLLWLHDGAWMYGSAAQEDEICYKLANLTGFIVVSASYRLAPEYPYPIPMNDALNALRWIAENIEQYGAHPKKILVGGEGAGGNLAAAAVARNLDMKHVPIEERVSVIGLLLVHPPLEMHSGGDRDGDGTGSSSSSSSSYVKYGSLNGVMTASQLEWAKAMYRSNTAVQPNDYAFAPLVGSPHLLKLFPNTVMVLAKHDILYDEGMKFMKVLKQRYVPTTVLEYGTTIYGFFGRSAYPAGDIAMLKVSEQLRLISTIYPESHFFEEDDFGGPLPDFPTSFP
jgi:acetyl esterase